MATGAQVPSNPLVLWAPSQNGFRLLAPHRQRKTFFPSGRGIIVPSAAVSCTDGTSAAAIISDPLELTLIVIVIVWYEGQGAIVQGARIVGLLNTR